MHYGSLDSFVVPDLNDDYSSSTCKLTEVFNNRLKLRTALIQGRENGEPMAPNLVAYIECQEKCSDSKSVAGNLSQYPIQFGTFSFDGKYYKEYDKIGCELMEMWRRSASTGGGLQTCPNCRIYMGESAYKSNSEFNSSPIRNLREVGLKLMLRSHTTSNEGVLRLVGKISRLSFQRD
jgi:hypothetical protein